MLYYTNATAKPLFCSYSSELIDGVQDILERDDLTHEQRVELAETLSTRHFEFEFDIEGEEIVVTVDAD